MADAGLGKEVNEGDYNGLVECMGHLMAVRDRVDGTDKMFEPLKHTIDLLKVGYFALRDYPNKFI